MGTEFDIDSLDNEALGEGCRLRMGFMCINLGFPRCASELTS